MPSSSPFLIHASTRSLTRASKAINADVDRDGGRIKLNLPPHQPAQNLQLLAFFGHKVLLLPSIQSWQQSALAGRVEGLSQLFPLHPYPDLSPWPVIPLPGAQRQKWGHSNRNGNDYRMKGDDDNSSLSSPGAIQHKLAQFDQLQWHHQEQKFLLSSGDSKFIPGGILRGGSKASAGGVNLSHGWSVNGSFLPNSSNSKVVSAKEVWRTWEEREGGMGQGCSLFDDNDVELIREMMAESVLSAPIQAHALAAGDLLSH